ncbi:MAG: twin-arginine translocase TatA/TatE family subunit [Acidimicrobiia bacterium]|nr:twin-arginine translocase TatA/TatE family subunit [Acidimicrobiia bacterium]NNK92652.1 twin-arginine translocase TatA/TatE family subunit [Acidimicrobiia bacterium]
MGSFSLGEFITIAVVALIVFGPRRLPEVARKAGELLTRARRAAADLRKEFDAEYREIAEPISDLRRDLRAFSSEMGDTARGAMGAIEEATDKPQSGPGPGSQPDADDPAPEAEDEAEDE